MSQKQVFGVFALFVAGLFGWGQYRSVVKENAELKLQNPIAKPDDGKGTSAATNAPAIDQKSMTVENFTSAVEAAFKKFSPKLSDIGPVLAAELVKFGVKPADVGPLMAAIKDLKSSGDSAKVDLGPVLARLEEMKKSPKQVEQEAKKLFREWQDADTSSILASIKEKDRQRKERGLLAKLRSRAYRDYKADTQYFKDRRHNRSQIGESQFVSGMLEQSDSEASKKMQKDRSDWEIESVQRDANGLDRIKTRLALHYGFTMSEIKELEKLDPGD